jgi:hypothetical protein
MKGLKEYLQKKESDFPYASKILNKAGYSIEKICKDLEEYNTTLVEKIEYSIRNEEMPVLIMLKHGQEYHRFYFDTAEDILSRIVKGLTKIPSTSYYESDEYKLQKELNDAKARASGFKNSGDMTKAYYEK